MNARAVALQLATAALLSSSLLWSTAAAVEPEKQPIYSNIDSNGLCGTPNNPCEVPVGQRLIIEHVSGFVFVTTSADTTGVSLLITDPQLGLNGSAFHTFVATKTFTSGQGTDTFSFSTPFRMMLHPGATFHFSPANAAAVSGYLVEE